MFKQVIFAVALFIQASIAGATTYYVDAAGGNDAWTGRLADPSDSLPGGGPWQSLAKASKAILMPGDVLALRCGSKWHETLRISSSGMAAVPITVRPYPSLCNGPAPAIEGFVRATSEDWSRQAPRLFKLQLPFNILPNGRFDRGIMPWRVWSPVGDAQLSVASSCGPDGSSCMQMKSGSGNQPTVVYGSVFSIMGGINYTLKFAFKAPIGEKAQVYVRRSVAPFDVVGTSAAVTGTGVWQSFSLPFSGLRQIDNARLDFSLPTGGQTISIDNVSISQDISSPAAAQMGTTPLITSHHPNRGFNGTEPKSPFMRAAGDGNVVPNGVGGTGSSYIPVGSDFSIPFGVQLRSGTTVRIRTNAWLIEERKVLSLSGSKLMLDSPTTYPLKADWGYYLLGEPWMVDEPGEWAYDEVSKALWVKTDDDRAPLAPIGLATLDTCIDVSGVKFVGIHGLAMSGCNTGVQASSSQSVILRDLRITDTSGNGVLASGSVDLQILASRIERSGEHAVLGSAKTGGVAYGLQLRDSVVIDSGVARVDGKVVTLPISTLGAIFPGEAATVLNSSISGAGYNGIRTYGGGLIKGNLIEGACLVLDDCAGIYGFGVGVGSRIEANVVRDILGGLDGKPRGSTSQSQGIFLDDHANGFRIIQNTVSGAESGILLHNAYNNTVQGNTLYGNRKHQLWLFEDSNSKNARGDVFGNIILDNKLFSRSPAAALGQLSVVNDTSEFGNFDRNRYSALFSNRVVSESWPTGSGSFPFLSWQMAKSPLGVARLPDLNGSVVNAIGFAAYRVLGGNIIPNGALESGSLNWTPWNDRAPMATALAANCNARPCLEVTGGGSVSLVATPAFSVVEGNWYRASFDVRSSVAGQSISVLVRRGGGGSNGYESLMGSAEMISTDTTFKRFAFSFISSKSINASDPVSKDIGARLYFDRIAPGIRIALANVEIVPVTAADSSIQTQLFTNSGTFGISVSCPDAGALESRCSQYVDFASGNLITWPLYVSPNSSVVAYSRDTTLVDSDGDGISDIQDKCPNTLAGAPTNASGCPL